MTPTKLLIGQIMVVFAIVLAGVWFATQWAAAALAYQPELGAPWFIAFGRPIYAPWAMFGWWFHFDAYAPHVFDEGRSDGRRAACRLRRRDLRVAVARPPAQQRHDLRIGALGDPHERHPPPACSTDAGVFLGALVGAIFATTARAHHGVRADALAARASAWSCRRCSAGPARLSSTTSRARTGS
jgi:hypothetical protein